MDLFDTTQLALNRAINGTSMRQTALADNLANANAPGYQRKDVDFHAALRSAINQGPAAIEASTVVAKPDSTAPMRVDGSNVDVDKENAAMAENGLENEALVTISKTRIDILKIALGVK